MRVSAACENREHLHLVQVVRGAHPRNATVSLSRCLGQVLYDEMTNCTNSPSFSWLRIIHGIDWSVYCIPITHPIPFTWQWVHLGKAKSPDCQILEILLATRSLAVWHDLPICSPNQGFWRTASKREVSRILLAGTSLAVWRFSFSRMHPILHRLIAWSSDLVSFAQFWDGQKVD